VSHNGASTQHNGEGRLATRPLKKEAHDVSGQHRAAQANSSPPEQPRTLSEAPGSRVALPRGLPVIDSPLGLKSLTAHVAGGSLGSWPRHRPAGPVTQAILAIHAVGYESHAELLIRGLKMGTMDWGLWAAGGLQAVPHLVRASVFLPRRWSMFDGRWLIPLPLPLPLPLPGP
jgi:hypothetical protein